jgi:Protein of unknown function (DUF1579)
MQRITDRKRSRLMKRFPLIVGVFVMYSGVLIGQKPPEMPKPGPEHQKLGTFVGNWTFEGEMKPGPMGPGGKITGTDRIQWLPGNFFVERRFEGKGPMGEMKGVEILAYDSAKKVHTFNVFDSTGSMGSGTLTLSGNTWTATGVGSMGGQTMHDRCTLALGAGGTTLTITCEMSPDGKKWAPSFEGKATKAK